MYEVAHHEPPYQDLCCLLIQLFSSLVHKELTCEKDLGVNKEYRTKATGSLKDC